MSLYRKTVIVFSPLLAAMSCQPTPPQQGAGFDIRKAPDGVSTLYVYKGRLPGPNDLVCTERPEVTPLLKGGGNLAVYKWVKAEGSFESRYEKIRETAKKQLEFEAARVRACHDFGNQAISMADWQRYLKEIQEFERQWLKRDISDGPNFDQKRSRALLLGFDSAFALAHSVEKKAIDQEVVLLNAYLKLLDIPDLQFPSDPLGSEKDAKPTVQFVQSVYAKLGAADTVLQHAFALGFYGVVSSNSPDLKPKGFDLREFAKKAGFADQSTMKDAEYLQWIADNSRKTLTVAAGGN
jgi:hypothetical protein